MSVFTEKTGWLTCYINSPAVLSCLLVPVLCFFPACKKKSSDDESQASAGTSSPVRTGNGGDGEDDDTEKTKFVSTDESDGQAKAVVRTSGDARKVVLITRLPRLKGTSVSFPPGSLASAVDLLIEEGMEAADRRNLDELGIDEDNIEAKGASVSILVSQNIDALIPFQISLVLPEGVDASSLDTSRIVVVSLQKKISGGGKIFRRVYTGDDLVLNQTSRKVTFSSQYFGIFQLVVLKSPPSRSLADSGETEVSTPLLSAAQVRSLPQVAWQTPLLKYNMFTRKFFITGIYNSDEFTMQSCSVVVRDQNSTTISYELEDGINTDFTFDVTETAAQKLKGYFRCTDPNGRAVDSPWSELQTVQEKTTFAAVINSGATAVNTKTVNLSFNATEATKAYVTRTSGCGSGGSWTDLTSLENKTMTFSFTEDNTSVTFYFILEDKWGNKGECTPHTFTHDTIAPTEISLKIQGGATHVNSVNVTINPVATGASHIYITNTAGCGSGGSWTDYGASSWILAQTGGTATVYIKYRDAAGNESGCVSDTIVHDEVAPTDSSLSISSGSSYASSTSISLSFSVTGASEMYVTNTAGCASGGSWEAYATSKTWTLGTSNGTATVYVRFRDEAGNLSSCVNDTIVHDSQAPSQPSSMTDGVTTSSTSSSPSMSWSASSDGGTGLSHYEIAVGTSAGDTDTLNWYNVGNVTTSTVSSLSLTWGGTYYASVRAVDAAGNPGTQTNGDGFVAGWLQQAYIKPENNDHANTGNQFGYAVAIDGDTLVIGAPYEDSNSTSIINGNTASSDTSAGDAGAVYVYRRSGATWTQEAYLKAPNTDVEDYFGWSVDIDGDYIVVGAYGEDSNLKTITNTDGTASSNNSNLFSGAAYVFKRSGTTWTADAYLKAPNNNQTSDSDQFGWSVAISGDLVAVGAPQEDHDQTTISTSIGTDNNNNTDAGAVYVYKRNSSNGNWEFKSFVKAANNEAAGEDKFGQVVDIDGSTLVVGVPLEDSNQTTITNGTTASSDDTASNSGAVYVYTTSDSGDSWTQQAYIKAVNAAANDSFGASVAVSGDTLVVGATGEDSDHTSITNGTSISGDNSNAPSSGAAYVYLRSSGSWSMQAYLKASNTSNAVESKFGQSVGISGNLIVVGALQDTADQASITNGTGSDANSGSSNSGAVFAYARTSTSWAQESFIKALNNGASDNFGYSVDVDSETMVIGAVNEDSDTNTIQNGNAISGANDNLANSGAAYVIDK